MACKEQLVLVLQRVAEQAAALEEAAEEAGTATMHGASSVARNVFNQSLVVTQVAVLC